MGTKEDIATDEEFQRQFDCDDVGPVEEYVGYRIERNEKDRSIRFTQPVLLQSYGDNFELTSNKPTTPAESGTTLAYGTENLKVGGKRHIYYQY